MKSAPVLVFRIDWSRKLLKACAGRASAEPDIALETGQLRETTGVVVEVWLVEVEPEVTLLAVVELVTVTTVTVCITSVIVVVWLNEPLAPPT
jgi:hypothetical protein